MPVLVADTVTLGTTEPEESVTIPEMLPVMLAHATAETSSIAVRAAKKVRRILISGTPVIESRRLAAGC